MTARAYYRDENGNRYPVASVSNWPIPGSRGGYHDGQVDIVAEVWDRAPTVYLDVPLDRIEVIP
ncbi:hypothetical protein QSJ18_18395 [Gordonia sp. ABSL1-1]|uniref:hypothetical protein n=1 Tax=Gordonia sp. ABSL1-1 TaxID=3053923 RepID=UPI0025727E7F|nr:hypothetical protein [Gordonia sp. ABSL1-1]MDL9938721.1 hypothetical protein [Gordonia sp. ABSL1-1]